MIHAKQWCALLALTGAVVLVACTVSPTGRKQLILPMFSDSEVSKMGVSAYEDLKKKQPLTKDPKTQQYVNCVAKAILNALPGDGGQGWEINVFQDDTANAFALPGRKIGVNSGLLKVAVNQDQLAAVVGHEIGHVQANHGAERLSNQFAAQGALAVAGVIAATSDSPAKGLAIGALGAGVTYGVLMPFSRTQESEADAIGLQLMAQAGFKPEESITLWQNMAAQNKEAPPEFLSTHPSSGTRIKDLSRLVPEADAVASQARAQGRRPNCKA